MEKPLEFTKVSPNTIPLPASQQPTPADCVCTDSELSFDDLKPLGRPRYLYEPLGEGFRVMDLVPFLTTATRRHVDAVPFLAARRDLALRLASIAFHELAHTNPHMVLHPSCRNVYSDALEALDRVTAGQGYRYERRLYYRVDIEAYQDLIAIMHALFYESEFVQYKTLALQGVEFPHWPAFHHYSDPLTEIFDLNREYWSRNDFEILAVSFREDVENVLGHLYFHSQAADKARTARTSATKHSDEHIWSAVRRSEERMQQRFSLGESFNLDEPSEHGQSQIVKPRGPSMYAQSAAPPASHPSILSHSSISPYEPRQSFPASTSPPFVRLAAPYLSSPKRNAPVTEGTQSEDLSVHQSSRVHAELDYASSLPSHTSPLQEMDRFVLSMDSRDGIGIPNELRLDRGFELVPQRSDGHQGLLHAAKEHVTRGPTRALANTISSPTVPLRPTSSDSLRRSPTVSDSGREERKEPELLLHDSAFKDGNPAIHQRPLDQDFESLRQQLDTVEEQLMVRASNINRSEDFADPCGLQARVELNYDSSHTSHTSPLQETNRLVHLMASTDSNKTHNGDFDADFESATSLAYPPPSYDSFPSRSALVTDGIASDNHVSRRSSIDRSERTRMSSVPLLQKFKTDEAFGSQGPVARTKPMYASTASLLTASVPQPSPPSPARSPPYDTFPGQNALVTEGGRAKEPGLHGSVVVQQPRLSRSCEVADIQGIAHSYASIMNRGPDRAGRVDDDEGAGEPNGFRGLVGHNEPTALNAPPNLDQVQQQRSVDRRETAHVTRQVVQRSDGRFSSMSGNYELNDTFVSSSDSPYGPRPSPHSPARPRSPFGSCSQRNSLVTEGIYTEDRAVAQRPAVRTVVACPSSTPPRTPIAATLVVNHQEALISRGSNKYSAHRYRAEAPSLPAVVDQNAASRHGSAVVQEPRVDHGLESVPGQQSRILHRERGIQLTLQPPNCLTNSRRPTEVFEKATVLDADSPSATQHKHLPHHHRASFSDLKDNDDSEGPGGDGNWPIGHGHRRFRGRDGNGPGNPDGLAALSITNQADERWQRADTQGEECMSQQGLSVDKSSRFAEPSVHVDSENVNPRGSSSDALGASSPTSLRIYPSCSPAFTITVLQGNDRKGGNVRRSKERIGDRLSVKGPARFSESTVRGSSQFGTQLESPNRSQITNTPLQSSPDSSQLASTSPVRRLHPYFPQPLSASASPAPPLPPYSPSPQKITSVADDLQAKDTKRAIADSPATPHNILPCHLHGSPARQKGDADSEVPGGNGDKANRHGHDGQRYGIGPGSPERPSGHDGAAGLQTTRAIANQSHELQRFVQEMASKDDSSIVRQPILSGRYEAVDQKESTHTHPSITNQGLELVQQPHTVDLQAMARIFTANRCDERMPQVIRRREECFSAELGNYELNDAFVSSPESPYGSCQSPLLPTRLRDASPLPPPPYSSSPRQSSVIMEGIQKQKLLPSSAYCPCASDIPLDTSIGSNQPIIVAVASIPAIFPQNSPSLTPTSQTSFTPLLQAPSAARVPAEPQDALQRSPAGSSCFFGGASPVLLVNNSIRLPNTFTHNTDLPHVLEQSLVTDAASLEEMNQIVASSEHHSNPGDGDGSEGPGDGNLGHSQRRCGRSDGHGFGGSDGPGGYFCPGNSCASDDDYCLDSCYDFSFDLRLKPSSIPEWDGNSDTLAIWILKLNALARCSHTLMIQMGKVVPTRLRHSAETWYYSQSTLDRQHAEESWYTLRDVIGGYYMNRAWLEKQRSRALRMQFREAGHASELPSDYVIRKSELLGLVYQLNDTELIMEVLSGAPAMWASVIHSQYYPSFAVFQNAIKYHEDTLIDLHKKGGKLWHSSRWEDMQGDECASDFLNSPMPDHFSTSQ